MVKNTKGGSGHKSMARKFVAGAGEKKTRFSTDAFEYYAVVEKVLGNGMCYVICIDKKKRLCHIRGKFRGRGKRDNTLSPGSWVLVGGRDFESERSGVGKDLENCDLLEVYNDLDIAHLREIGIEFASSSTVGANEAFEFSNDTGTEEYHGVMESIKSTKIVFEDDDEEETQQIDVDDI
jgi:initiation factor 1A